MSALSKGEAAKPRGICFVKINFMKLLGFLVGCLITAGAIIWGLNNQPKIQNAAQNVKEQVKGFEQRQTVDSKIEVKITEIPKPVEKNVGSLARYNFENLKKRENKASEIKKIGEVLGVEVGREDLKQKGKFNGYGFESRAISFESEGKKVSGMMNIPNSPPSQKTTAGKPAIIMIRGFAEKEGYFIGSGSWKVADELARNGFITVSLDFFGYALSEDESTDILEARFEKPVSVLDLIESVKKMDIVDPTKIGIWSHSNGGQIALSILEITGKRYPTVLWAPMTKPFPASILSMAAELDDNGKLVKDRVDAFEKEYDSKLYSIDNFYSWISAPILLHQGTADEWCKVSWQQDLQSRLKSIGKEITLDIKQGNDHNMKQSLDEVVISDIAFFKKML